MIETSRKVLPLLTDRLSFDGDGRPVLMGMRCRECGRTAFPRCGLCPRCGTPSTDEVELPRKGTVWTYTLVNVSYGSVIADPPYITAFVELSGGAFVHTHIVGCGPEEVRIGMEVELDAVETKTPDRGESVAYAFRPVRVS